MTKQMVILSVFLLGIVIFGLANAGCYKCTTNYYPMTITSGVSDKDLSEGLAGMAALTFHHFDHGTHDWQWSASGSYESGNESNSFSGALAVRPEWADVLLSGAFTQMGDDEYFVFAIGGRF